MRKNILCFSVSWLLFTCSLLAQSAMEQKITLHTTATLEEILTELSSTYGLRFSYSNNLVPLQQEVSIQAEDQPLKLVLDELFRDKNIRYTLLGEQIILNPVSRKENSQQKEHYTISGYITDAATGEALPGATIITEKTGASANTYGFYSLRVDGAPLHLRYLGYDPFYLRLPALKQDTTISFQLQPAPFRLQEVGISARKVTDLKEANLLSIRGEEMKELPRMMGEADAIKAIQLMPGAMAGREGSSDLIVRGGSPDQNLILLDGVPVYNVSHLLGTFSVFNPDAIKNVDLIKGGFPAPYGGRLSSVVDVQLKEGNNQRFSGEGAVGLISSKLLLEGPVKNGKTAYLIAARRTYLDLIIATLGALSGESMTSYNFYDLNAKINHTFSEKDRIFLSVYAGQDKFSDKQEFSLGSVLEEQKFRMQWGNITSALRWNHVYGPSLFSNLTFTHSRYSFGQDTELKTTESRFAEEDITFKRQVDYGSSIRDWGAKADFDYAAHPKHHIRFGGSYTFHHFRPEAVRVQADSISLTTDSFSLISAHEFYTYAEDQIQLNEHIQARVGAHFSGFAVNGTFYKSLQPRLALGYKFSDNLSVHTSFATMTQYLHLLSNTSTGTPTDIWVPATDKVKPQRSWQVTLGGATLLAQNKLELTAELYYKKMKDVAEFKAGSNFVNDFLRSGPETNFANFVAPPYESRISSGEGWSYGSEWMLRKRHGKTTGWLGYTLAWSWRQLEGINFNQKYPYTYDSRHNISIVINHQLTEKLSIGGNWVYHTGFITTLPSANYKAYNEPLYQPDSWSPSIETVDYIGEHNNYRMPAYHRLDLSMTHTKKKKWGERSWNISVYNAYNRMNPYFIQLSSPGTYYKNSSQRMLYKVSLFPIIPSVSYGFKF
ncbi:TonB-dependent receptor plug domain-containing protein [Nafulsella turpanensis]|uniref:TonB-dependent receptor plug domain-containing protein n=1 Tax=Nafulsella turpanensis TaxID=1265690 RepID=UPI0003458EFE|nr:TonB-dependent receptor plug domain-containing protein [Nafulsella turpanensis]